MVLLLVGCLLAITAYFLPPIHTRLVTRVEGLQTEIRYALNPPEEAIFIPQGSSLSTMEAIAQATVGAALSTQTAAAAQFTPAPTSPGATSTPLPSPSPTLTPAPLPDKIALPGIRHEWQQMNNCGPTTLAMALSFWGWQGDQRDTRAYLRPNFGKVDDKNVSPAEMVAYIQSQTGLKALDRVGGNIDLLKRLLAAGFPVMIEKGLQPEPKDWMGHYALVSGYDDTRQVFLTQDSYTGPGVDVVVPFSGMDQHWWRDFNYTYLVIFPPEREAEVLEILGPQADSTANFQYAADFARQEASALSGRDQYFAWYNLGSNLTALGDYAGAAQAYDLAFGAYPGIPADDRPWRMLWYQTGPYQAYFETGRYQDVIDLGSQTLAALGKPILEETLYWMGRAREAQGDLPKAIANYEAAYDINPISTPAQQELRRLGVAYPQE